MKRHDLVVHLRGCSEKIPLLLKITCTLYVGVLVPVYWHYYGPANFLWFSDLALFFTLAALWLESPLLASMQAVSVGLLEMLWIVDFVARLATGVQLVGIADYMFEPAKPLGLRGLSLFHLVLPPLLFWLVYRLGYDRRAWIVQTLFVVAGVILLVAWTCRDPVAERRLRASGSSTDDLRTAVERLNIEFRRHWSEAGIAPTARAEDLQVLRRLSLALHGSVPSLEEIRRFEADVKNISGDELIGLWVRRLLADDRFHAYFAERLARAYVGTDGTPPFLFRRDRFVQWLRERLRQGTPYDNVVREIVAQTGVWTDRPATNFVTSALMENQVDENKLAGRTVRAFLGQRIDCAQCHDHPFDDWKQSHFEGLAAFYGQTKLSIVGIEDRTHEKKEPVVYRVEDRKTLEKRVVDEAVPFHPEWLPKEGSRRARLAEWLTHPDNRRFERAIANRIWALMFGRAWHEPVDDLKNPPERTSDVLDILGQDFREHGCDIRRLIQVIALSEPFRLDSISPPEVAGKSKSPDSDAVTSTWAVFPLVRLRPEQVIGSILQSSTVQTADQNSHLFFRFIRLVQGAEFLKEYSDLGADELQGRGGTIPQRLILMNGKLAGGAIEPNPVTSAGRIFAMSSSPEHIVETAYLVCLTRRPAPEEKSYFVRQLTDAQGNERAKVVEDLFWSLLNSTEFAWNH